MNAITKLLILLVATAGLAVADLRPPSVIPTGGGGWYNVVSGVFLSVAAFFTGRMFWRRRNGTTPNTKAR